MVTSYHSKSDYHQKILMVTNDEKDAGKRNTSSQVVGISTCTDSTVEVTMEVPQKYINRRTTVRPRCNIPRHTHKGLYILV